MRLVTKKRHDNGDWAIGKMGQRSWVDDFVEGDVEVRRHDGTLLCKIVPGGIGRKSGAAMFRAVLPRIYITKNRGVAGGEGKHRAKRRDGSLSSTNVGKFVLSSLLGFFDRYPRTPYCRKTKFLHDHPEAYRACLPALHEADEVFKAGHPEAYARQRAIADKTSRDFVIPGTTFTTVTMNRNFQTAGHRDAGDLPDGFGVMTYYRSGRFSGGDLVFPAYRVAARLETCDVILFDPHEVHCNTPLIALNKSEFNRVTCVHYYRKKMFYCGSAAQELKLARDHDPRKASRNLTHRFDLER